MKHVTKPGGPQRHDRVSAAGAMLLLSLVLPRQGIAGIPEHWESRGIGGGGALFSPSFNPDNPDEIALTCDMSELFRTSDLGHSWKPVDFAQFQGNNGATMRYVTGSPVRYAINFAGDLMRPFRSTDGGTRWNPTGSDPTDGETYSVYVHPGDPNLVLVSDYSRIFLSTNGGSTFAQKYSSTGAGGGCYVAGAFFSGDTIVVGIHNGILVSTNRGSSFALQSITGIPSGEAIVSLCGAGTPSGIRFFCVTIGSSDIYPGITGADFDTYASVYALDWGAGQWTQRTNGIASGHHPFFVDMARTSGSVAYLAGGSDAGSPIVYRTTNAGSSWVSFLNTVNNQNVFTGWSGHGGDRGWSYGEYALGFAVAPSDPDRVIMTDLGFPHLTTDGGITWHQAYVAPSDEHPMGSPTPTGRSYHGIGLENTSCWWLTWPDAGTIVAAYSDIRGTRSTDGGASWSFNYTGHSLNTMYSCVAHPGTGVLYAATSSLHDMYQSTYLTDARIDGGAGRLLLSSDAGHTWQTMKDFGHPVIGLSLDPQASKRLYATVIHSTDGGIWVSDNIQNGPAATWTKLANPPRTEGHPFVIRVLDDGTLVCSYAGRRGGSPQAFTASSGVFVSTNAGASWMDRSDNGMLYWTKDVVIDPHDASQNTWYACVFSGWGGPPNGLGGLYRTTNRGTAWTRISARDRVGSCTVSPVDPEEMYFTTETEGLWSTSNLHSGSPVFSRVNGYPFRQPERVFYNPYASDDVWVTSFGGGLFVGDATSNTVSGASPLPLHPHLLRNFPNPFNPTTTLQYDLPQASHVTLRIRDILGREVALLVNGRVDAGHHAVRYDGTGMPTGVYFCTMDVMPVNGAAPFRDTRSMVLMK